MRALIVARSSLTRAAWRDLLRRDGFQAVEAEEPRQALDAFRDFGAFDLALVDWTPAALDLVQRVRGEPSHDGTRIVMVLPEVDASPMIEALKAGVDEYLLKPFTAGSLGAKLRALGFGRGGRP